MKLAACIFIKIFQVVFTVAATIVKKLSDRYSERLLTSNKKRLTEWMLLNTISLTKATDEFSLLIFMGYSFISIILLICRIKEKSSNYHICEIILLSFGLIFFTIQGFLIFGILEQLPDDILTYGYSLGALSFICAALFGIDLLFFKQMTDFKDVNSQTDFVCTAKTTKQAYIITNNDELHNVKHVSLPVTTNYGHEPKYLRTDL